MRLTKLDEPSSHMSKVISTGKGTYRLLRGAASNSRVEASVSSSPPQLLTMAKPPEVSSPPKTFTTILNGNEFIVDSNGDLMTGTALERYIPQDYEPDLIHDDLTDDDRRLAAALVAVQLVNQQKQHTGTHLMPLYPTKLLGADNGVADMPPLSGPNKPTDSSPPNIVIVSGANGHSFTQSGTNGSHLMSNNLLQTLPPLKRVVAKSRQVRQEVVPHSQVQLESLGLHQEIDDIALTIASADGIKPQEIEYVLHDVKDEFDSEEDSEANESDDNVSEHNRRQSLPHKKRIAQRLRQPKKPPLQRVKTPPKLKQATGSTQTPQTQMYSCEICGQVYANQLLFFEHLKWHYEPKPMKPANPAKSTSQQVVSKVQTPQRSGKSQMMQVKASDQGSMLRQRLLPPTPPKLTKGSSKPAVPVPATPVVNRVQRVARPTTTELAREPKSKPPTTSVGGQLQDIINSAPSLLDLELNGSEMQTLWECQPCKLIFRRQKAFESHMALIHQKEENIEEFSDTEDMMAGIKMYVVSDEEREHGSGNSNIREVRHWYDGEELTDEVFASSVDGMKVESVDCRESETFAIADECGQVLKESHEGTKKSKNRSAKGMAETDVEDIQNCSACNMQLRTKHEMTQHITEMHPSELQSMTASSPRCNGGAARKGDLECKECGRRFHYRNSLLYHVRSHTGKRPFQCEVCGKGFYAKSALKVHMRQHSGVKPYKCNFCSRCFRQWGDLKYHVISIHSDQRNYQCEFCGKDFARKYSLTVHSRIHTGERNYRCEFCDKTFRAASYLQNHRRIHTGEKPYSCEVCLKPFRVRSDMKRHMFTHKQGSKRSLVKPKIEVASSSNNSADSKTIDMNETSDYDTKDISLPEIGKVEELEVSTVEGILSEETVRASEQLQVEMSSSYIPNGPQKEPNTLYFWQVFQT